MSEPVISIVIPAYKEDNIDVTVSMMWAQKCQWPYEVVVAEYTPDGVSTVGPRLRQYITYVNVDRPGIAYARHQGITASRGKVIVNFDADAVFSHTNALELLCKPIIDGQAVLCVCDNAFNSDEAAQDPEAMKLPQSILDFLNNTQRIAPFIAFLECGSAMDRSAYMFVGGFRDVKMWELFNLSPIMLWQYPGMKRWVNGVVAVTSARRALASSRYGVRALDYSTAYRSGGPVKVT